MDEIILRCIICSDGSFDDVPTSSEDLDRERFNMAIKRAISAGLERQLARRNGHEPVARQKRALVEDMEKSLRCGWMISLLLKFGRLYAVEELERKREESNPLRDGSSKMSAQPKKPSHRAVRGRRTLGDEAQHQGNDEAEALQKIKQAPSVETPPKKHRAAAAQTLTVLEEDDEDDDSDDVIQEDKDHKDYESITGKCSVNVFFF